MYIIKTYEWYTSYGFEHVALNSDQSESCFVVHTTIQGRQCVCMQTCVHMLI